MVGSKLSTWLLFLLVYWLVSASLLCRFLLTVDTPSEASVAGDSAPQLAVVRKLFRHPDDVENDGAVDAATVDDIDGREDAVGGTPVVDAAALELAGFRLARLPTPPDGSGNATSASTAAGRHFFDLRRRHLLARSRPDSPEAAVRRGNAARLDFRLRLAPRGPCGRIFVAVMTTSRAADRRAAIRTTWASEAAAAGARVVFFIADVSENASEPRDDVLTRLEAENAIHGDLAMVSTFTDSYRHLTLKVLAALDFACRRCPGAPMFAKVDDDSILNLAALRSKWLDRCEHKFPPGLQYVLGYRYETPAVKRQGRWRVTRAEYPLDRFPSYMFGGAYALRADTCRMVAAARYFPIPPIEDAFVTGVLPAALGVRQVADNSGFACQFFNHAGSLNAAAFRSGLVMSGTDLTPQYMLSFWRRYLRLGELERLEKNATRVGVTASFRA